MCTLGLSFRSGRTDMVALPFCSITLTAPKPSKIPQNPQTIGDHIRKRRLELGLTQAQVAIIVGVTESTVTNWEKNRTRPVLKPIPEIIKFLEYSPASTNPKTLGERIFEYRRTFGVSQKEMARRIGIDPTTLSRIERNRGKRLSSVEKKIADFFALRH